MKPNEPLTLNTTQEENLLEKVARIIICVLAAAFMGFLTVVSLLHTTGMDTVPDLESVSYLNDDFIGNIILLVLSLAFCFIIMPLLKKIPLWAELTFIALWTIVLGIIWVYSSQSSPTEDSWVVTNAAKSFANNDYSPLEETYFKNYSFQLGYVFFNEIIIRIVSVFTEIKNLLFLEVLNVILLAAVNMAVILINNLIFDDKRIRHMTVVLLTFSFQPILFSSFIYGIIPGLAFAVWSLYFEFVWIKKDKIYAGILSAVFIAIAIMIKSNYSIFLIAMVGIAFVMMFRRKKYIRDIIYICLCAALSFSISPIVKSMYESRSGIDLGDSVPYISWISMGLNEPGFESLAPGWYNSYYTLTNFETHDFDPDAASESSLENIKERLTYFHENPQYRRDFFYEKIVSQWNETTYQSIWTNQVRGQYAAKGSIAEWVCGDGEDSVSMFMDIYSQFIFAAVFAGIIFCMKRKNFLYTTMPLIILGGFMYHLISEAKSQYSMPYFILMIGFAAYGIISLLDLTEKKAGNIKWVAKLFGFSVKTNGNKKTESDAKA